MLPSDRVFAVPDLVDSLMTRARIAVIDPKAAPSKLAPGRVSLYCVARALRELDVVPMEALVVAGTHGHPDHATESSETIRMAMS
jgi:hypothetical protein